MGKCLVGSTLVVDPKTGARVRLDSLLDDDIRATQPGAIYVLGNELNNIVGIYQLTAFHDADGGNCDADAMVKLDGDPLSTPIGAGATAGLVITGAGVLSAGIKKKAP